jgi:hypothetical protein
MRAPGDLGAFGDDTGQHSDFGAQIERDGQAVEAGAKIGR